MMLYNFNNFFRIFIFNINIKKIEFHIFIFQENKPIFTKKEMIFLDIK
jgi:hypothetical protein